MPILAIDPGAGAPVDTSSAWRGATLTWTGADGQVWDLSDPSSGVVLSDGGITGLGMPPMTRYSATAPAVAGSRWKGWRVDEREVFLPVFIFSSSSSAQWVSRDRAFWAGVRPDAYGVLTYSTADGESRSLRCRFSDDGTYSVSRDPNLTGWSLYGLTLVADEHPLWEGTRQRWEFSAGTTAPFFSGAGGVVTISPSQTLSDASVTNLGDVDAWPAWSVTGPVDQISLGVGGGTVTYLAPVAAGQTVSIDTDPREMSVVDGSGVDLSANATFRALPCPPGNPVELDIEASGAGAAARVSMTLTPQYFRAW